MSMCPLRSDRSFVSVKGLCADSRPSETALAHLTALQARAQEVNVLGGDALVLR